jgi:hypothetical protein
LVVSVTVFFHFNRVIENHRNDRNELHCGRELDLLVVNLYFRRNKVFKKLWIWTTIMKPWRNNEKLSYYTLYNSISDFSKIRNVVINSHCDDRNP